MGISQQAQKLAIRQLSNPLPDQRASADCPAVSAINPRIVFVTLEVIRAVRGCDAETVLKSIGDATRPNLLRWVFDVSPSVGRKIRELRFWKAEIWSHADKWAAPEVIIPQILGTRQGFSRGEIEIQWVVNSTTISRLVNAGELTEVNHKLTRASLAAFLERRLQ